MPSGTKERSTSTVPVVASTGYCPAPGTSSSPSTANSFLLLPRCKVKVEECKDGCKIHCVCDDDVACSMLQNLCRMLEGGVCGFSCVLNGACVCNCTLSCGHCTCELTKDGCCITCTSGDTKCCDVIQSCCDCLKCCLESGCTCCITLNGTPVCCCVAC